MTEGVAKVIRRDLRSRWRHRFVTTPAYGGAVVIPPEIPMQPSSTALLITPRAGTCLATTRFEPTQPVLRLDDIGVGSARLSLQAHPGEIVHLGGGTAVARLRLLTRAAGFVQGSSGRCALRGLDLQELSEPQRLAWREQHVARVLMGDSLPHAATVQASVAMPLVRQGGQIHEALASAAAALDELGAGHLALRTPVSLNVNEQRLALLARALASRPSLLVLEQPEQGLRATQVGALRLALWALSSSGNSCVLMSSDHPRLLASADRYVDLDSNISAS
jgi:predicted ABC-type transport system involved in lysophospholipase L1 biosynthesis ATPase subunit